MIPSVARGPAGTVPLVRPNTGLVSRILAVKNYTAKRGGLAVNKSRPTKARPIPARSATSTRIDSQSGKLLRLRRLLQRLGSRRSITPPGPGDDHSIMQIWLQNYDKPQLQSIEGGWTVDKNLNGDTIAHVFTYYTTNGYTQDGNDLGGYNRMFAGWVQYSASIFPGIRINGAQHAGRNAARYRHQVPALSGQRWIAVQRQLDGLLPRQPFQRRIVNDAEWFGFGGEVYSSLAIPRRPKIRWAAAGRPPDGWTQAAFARNLRNQSDTTARWSTTTARRKPTRQTEAPNPYTSDAHEQRQHLGKLRLRRRSHAMTARVLAGGAGHASGSSNVAHALVHAASRLLSTLVRPVSGEHLRSCNNNEEWTVSENGWNPPASIAAAYRRRDFG